MATLISSPRIQLVDEGAALVGAKLYTLATGTATPVATYTNAALTVQNSNPIISDANGFFPAIYPDPDLGALKFRFFDANDVNLGVDTDPAYSPPAALTAEEVGLAIYPRTAAEEFVSVTPTDYTYPPHDVRRFGWSSANSAATNTTAITSAIAAASAFTGYGATIKLPEGSFNCNTFNIPQYVMVRGAGGSGTILTNDESGYFIRVGGAKSGVIKYQCGITDVGITLTHKDGHGIQVMETKGAEVKRIYGQGTLTASRSNIFLRIDGGDISSYHNHIEDCIANHFETAYLMVTSGTTAATQTKFNNCSAIGDVGSFPNSVGIRIATGEGSGSKVDGGNFEACGRGAKLESGCKSLTFHGTRFEGNTYDVEAEVTSGASTFLGCFLEQVTHVLNTGNRAAFIGCVNGSSQHGLNEIQGETLLRAVVNGDVPLTLKGFPGYTTEVMLQQQNSAGSVKGQWRQDGTMQAVAGISATTTASKNLRGSATFAAGTTVAVTFASAEPDASYYVELTAQADPVGRLWVSSKGTGGFTINNSSSTSITVDWVLIR